MLLVYGRSFDPFMRKLCPIRVGAQLCLEFEQPPSLCEIDRTGHLDVALAAEFSGRDRRLGEPREVLSGFTMSTPFTDHGRARYLTLGGAARSGPRSVNITARRRARTESPRVFSLDSLRQVAATKREWRRAVRAVREPFRRSLHRTIVLPLRATAGLRHSRRRDKRSS